MSMTPSQPKLREMPAALGLVIAAVAGGIICIAGFLTSRPWAPSGGIPIVLGSLLGVALALLAPLTSALPAAMRHIYLLHYAAVAGFGSIALLFPLAGFLDTGGWYYFFALLAMAAAPPMVMGHLAGCVTGQRRLSSFLAVCAAIVTMLLLLPAGGIWGLFFVAGFLGILIYTHLQGGRTAGIDPEKDMPAPYIRSWNVGAYVVFNLAALLGLGAVTALVLAIMIQAPGSSPPPVFREGLASPESAGALYGPLALRVLGALAGFVVAGGFVFAWPAIRPNRFHAAAAAICLVAIASLAGRTTLMGMAIALLVSLPLLIFASSAVAFWPRKKRWPPAIIAGATGALLLAQIAYPLLDNLLHFLVWWILESIGFAGIWLVAYFGGIHVLRAKDV